MDDVCKRIVAGSFFYCVFVSWWLSSPKNEINEVAAATQRLAGGRVIMFAVLTQLIITCTRVMTFPRSERFLLF